MAEQVVRDSIELAAAVADMNIDIIYFGADIELTAGITIPAAKTSLLFDGTYEGVTHRFTDMNSNQSGNTLHIGGASSIALTFQNMDMTGRNYYGIPYISESNTSNVTVTYRDISYVGPQLAFNSQGLTHFENVDITISPSAASPAEEVGEVCRVEFAGDNVIRHNSTTDAVFWFRGAAGSAYFRLLPDATLTVDSANYFMYNILIFTQYPVAYELQQGSSFTLNSNHGISYDSSHIASSFLVGTGASFRYIQAAANGTAHSLYISGSFTVNENASVYMQADFNGAQPLLNFTAGTAIPFNINNPKSFVLYDRASAPVAITTFASRNYSITSEQLNHWTAPGTFPGAGSFTDIPQNKWANPNWSVFTVSGNVTPTATTASGSGLVVTQPPLTNFTFQSARVISAGSIIIAPDPVIDNGRPITGQTEPDANLIISFTVEGTPYSFSLTADGDGRFELDPGMSLPIGTIINISANTPFLIKAIETSVVSVGGVSIVDAPDRIAFGTPPVSASPLLLRRLRLDVSVYVNDSRPYPTRWELLALITGPLEAASGEVMENAVVFKDDDDILWELGLTPIVVHTGGPVTGTTEISWADDKGVLVRVTEPIRSGVKYTTQLGWALNVLDE